MVSVVQLNLFYGHLFPLLRLSRLESSYRTWVREKRETLSPEGLDELCRELQTALGTAKWQVHYFSCLSHSHSLFSPPL